MNTNDSFYGLPSYLTPSVGQPHEPGKPWDVRLPSGDIVQAPWNENQGLFVGMGGDDTLVTTDPQQIADYRDDARVRAQQGAVRVLALVGGAALGGALAGPANAAPGATTAAGGGAGGAVAGAAPAAAPATIGGIENILITAPAVSGAAVPAIAGGVAALPSVTTSGSAPQSQQGPPAPAAVVPSGGAGPLIGQGGQDMTAALSSGGTFFQRVGTFLTNNRDIIGSVLAGVGEQIAGANAQSDLLREEHELRASNYRGTSPGRTFRAARQNTQTVKPSERYGVAPVGGYGLAFDPIAGKMVRELMPGNG